MNQVVGRLLWQELHHVAQRPIAHQQVYFPRWANKVSFAGCSTCSIHLRKFVEKWPPDFGKGFKLWAMCFHDYVNKQMAKPLFAPHLTLAPLKEHGIIQ